MEVEHAPTLKALFESYAYGSGDVHDKLNKVDAMVYEEWTEMVDHVGWTLELTDRKVAQIFAWSRMLVVDEHSIIGRGRQLRLTYDGFLEAMVRVA